jgi:large conductance mechanosensitive channel
MKFDSKNIKVNVSKDLEKISKEQLTMLDEFKKFALRGNVVDLAVGFIMGAAFGKIVTSLVQDIVMPPIGLLLGRVNFSNLFINLGSQKYTSLEEAKIAGAPTINYGLFINNILDFVVVAFVIFLLVRQINKMTPTKAECVVEKKTTTCPYCQQAIPELATRCPFCTSQLDVPKPPV